MNVEIRNAIGTGTKAWELETAARIQSGIASRRETDAYWRAQTEWIRASVIRSLGNFRRDPEMVEEAVAEATAAVVRAFGRYDPAAGYRLVTYVMRDLNGAVALVRGRRIGSAYGVTCPAGAAADLAAARRILTDEEGDIGRVAENLRSSGQITCARRARDVAALVGQGAVMSLDARLEQGLDVASPGAEDDDDELDVAERARALARELKSLPAAPRRNRLITLTRQLKRLRDMGRGDEASMIESALAEVGLAPVAVNRTEPSKTTAETKKMQRTSGAVIQLALPMPSSILFHSGAAGIEPAARPPALSVQLSLPIFSELTLQPADTTRRSRPSASRRRSLPDRSAAPSQIRPPTLERCTPLQLSLPIVSMPLPVEDPEPRSRRSTRRPRRPPDLSARPRTVGDGQASSPTLPRQLELGLPPPAFLVIREHARTRPRTPLWPQPVLPTIGTRSRGSTRVRGLRAAA